VNAQFRAEMRGELEYALFVTRICDGHDEFNASVKNTFQNTDNSLNEFYEHWCNVVVNVFMNATKTAKFCDENGALFQAVVMVLHACFMPFVITYIVLMNGHADGCNGVFGVYFASANNANATSMDANAQNAQRRMMRR
jgi:hypothetical protein